MMVVKLIGIFITVMGLVIFLYPKVAKRMVVFWRQGNNLYMGGLIRVLLGVIFLYYAPQAKLPQVMFVLGILAFLGGLLIFILGLKKQRQCLTGGIRSRRISYAC